MVHQSYIIHGYLDGEKPTQNSTARPIFTNLKYLSHIMAMNGIRASAVQSGRKLPESGKPCLERPLLNALHYYQAL
ncbi:hypothetical protein V0R37_11780 [Pollutimonas sp. H1-120]|uniref:hypothetical protein n=1 Tax=Pollutimonas sp. H1-120 TaxID=3148824 RepID=UPI003B518458